MPVAGSAKEGAPVLAVASSEAPPPVQTHRATPAPASNDTPTWSQVAARAQGWTVAVRADQSYGAGVAVDRNGFVLTNLHVVDGAKSITVTPFGAEAVTATLLDSDRELDLALLHVSSPLANAAAIGRPKALGVGDEVMAVGSPRKMYFSVSRGMVSYPNRFLDGVEYIQTDLPINVGNSGGPLVNEAGDVVGIVSFILRDSQGISFALPIDRAVTRFSEHLTIDTARARDVSQLSGTSVRQEPAPPAPPAGPASRPGASRTR